MQTTSIERAKLKGYIPTFTAVKEELVANATNKNLATLETHDSDLLPIIKLLHSVYVQQVA